MPPIMSMVITIIVLSINNAYKPIVLFSTPSWYPAQSFFYQKPTHTTLKTNGFGSNNTPFYFTSRNIEVAKDINNNDIGYCPQSNNTLTRASGTDYCKKYGRVYTLADAVKACEVYSEQHEAETGLLFRLPSTADYQTYFDRVEQEAGSGNVGYWLKSYQFEKYNGSHNTVNALGFNAQAGGSTISGYTTSNAPFNAQQATGGLWTSTPDNSLAKAVSFYNSTKYAQVDLSTSKLSLKRVRCIGSLTQ
jgi:uncharacterized protein (TIGR02145 family)